MFYDKEHIITPTYIQGSIEMFKAYQRKKETGMRKQHGFISDINRCRSVDSRIERIRSRLQERQEAYDKKEHRQAKFKICSTALISCVLAGIITGYFVHAKK